MPYDNVNLNLLLSSWYFRILLAIGLSLMFIALHKERKRLDSLYKSCFLLTINLVLAIFILGLGPVIENCFSFFYKTGLVGPFIFLRLLSEIKFSIIGNYFIAFGLITGIYAIAIIAHGNSIRQYKQYGLLSSFLIFCLVDIYFYFIVAIHYNIIDIFLNFILCNIIGALIAGNILGYLYDYFNNILDKNSIRDKREETQKLIKYAAQISIVFILFIIIFMVPIVLSFHSVLDKWNSISFNYSGNISVNNMVYIKDPSSLRIGYSTNIQEIKIISILHKPDSTSQRSGKFLVPITISVQQGKKINNIYKGKIPEGDLKIEGKPLSISFEGAKLTILSIPYGTRVTYNEIVPVLISADHKKINSMTYVRTTNRKVKYQVVPKTRSQIKISMDYIGSLKGANPKISLPNGEDIVIPPAPIMTTSTISIGEEDGNVNNYEISFYPGDRIVSILSNDKLFWLPEYGQLVNNLMIKRPIGMIYYGDKNIIITPNHEFLYIGGDMLSLKNDNGKLSIDGNSNSIVLGDLVLSLSWWQRISSQLQGSILGALIGLIGGYLIGVLDERRRLGK